jgi:hypothetical protein
LHFFWTEGVHVFVHICIFDIISWFGYHYLPCIFAHSSLRAVMPSSLEQVDDVGKGGMHAPLLHVFIIVGDIQ